MECIVHQLLLTIRNSAAVLDMTVLWTSQIAHFTVTGENKGGVDLVLIQPFLLFYVNHVVLIC